MSQVSDAIRSHHRQFVNQYADQVIALSEGKSKDWRGLVKFLREDLLPHAQGEEQHLYPILDPIIREHGRPTATMTVDHEFITYQIGLMETAAEELGGPTPVDRAEREARLRLLAVQLGAVLRLHIEKEEKVYLPLMEQHLPEAEQERVLHGMHEACEGRAAAAAADPKTTVDVRPLPPARRHQLIFSTFEALAPGEAFVLVNDHDPRPLRYQFQYEHDGHYSWNYLEEGPEVWRVRIGKTACHH